MPTTDSLPENVLIKTSEYLQLVKSDLTLNELYASGVDNWEGYEEVDRSAIEIGVNAAEARLDRR